MAVARVLAEVDDTPEAARLVLENSSGSGFGLGTSVAELTDIAEAIAARGIADERIGFCLDTAHAWGAGVDLSRPDGVDAFLADFDGRIGLDRLVMVHLNDSKSERGSHADRHEHLGAGRIGAAGLARILTHPGLSAGDVLPRDARHGRGLRRGQRGPGLRPGGRPAARRPAARGARRCEAAAPGPGRADPAPTELVS